MKTPLTFQIILMALAALTFGLAMPPRAPTHAKSPAVAAHSAPAQRLPAWTRIESEFVTVYDTEGTSSYATADRIEFISCAGTNYAAMLEKQPKEFPDRAAEVPFMIQNSGTIYMNDSGSGLNLESTYSPVAPTWTPVE